MVYAKPRLTCFIGLARLLSTNCQVFSRTPFAAYILHPLRVPTRRRLTVLFMSRPAFERRYPFLVGSNKDGNHDLVK